MIQLTLEQRLAIQQGNAVRLADTELGAEVVVCPAALFEKMESQLREFLEDEKEQQEWVHTSMQNLARRIEEDDND